MDQIVDLGDGLNAGKPGADHNEGEQLALEIRLRGHVGHFQAADDVGAQAVRIGEVLHGERVLGQTGEAIEVDAHAERNDELVIGKVDGDAAEALHDGHGLLGEVDAHDVGLADLNAAQQEPQRRHRVGGVNRGCGDFGQQRLEDEVVVVVDQFDVELVAAAPRKLLGGEYAAKSTADDENLLLFHEL